MTLLTLGIGAVLAIQYMAVYTLVSLGEITSRKTAKRNLIPFYWIYYAFVCIFADIGFAWDRLLRSIGTIRSEFACKWNNLK